MVRSSVCFVDGTGYYLLGLEDVYELTPGIVLSLLQNGDGMSRELKKAKKLPDDLARLVRCGRDVVVHMYRDDTGLHILRFDSIRAIDLSAGQYITVDMWARQCGKSLAAAKRQCMLGRVKMAVKIGGIWLVPAMAEYPKRQSSSGVRVVQLPAAALSDMAFRYLDGLSGMSEERLACGGQALAWPFCLDKRPDDDVLYRISDVQDTIIDECRRLSPVLFPNSLLHVLDYVLDNEFDEIELIDTAWSNQLVCTAWVDEGERVYAEDEVDENESNYSERDALMYASRRSELKTAQDAELQSIVDRAVLASSFCFDETEQPDSL